MIQRLQRLTSSARRFLRPFSKSYRLKIQELRQKLENEVVERRQVEKELAHLASFPEWDPNCIIETDLSGNIQYINPAGHREFSDLKTFKINHPIMKGLDDFVDQIRRDKQAGSKRTVTYQNKVYEQQVSIFEENARVRIYMLDITELKKLDRLKSEFVNMVSHELRTPLAAIQATVQLVSSGMLGAMTAEQSEALSLALQNVERLGRMITDLLDLSKMEAGKLRLHREWVDAALLVESVGRSFEALAQKKGILLRIQIAQRPLPIYVDSDKVTQVLTNLLSNAMKFTEKGSIALSIDKKENGLELAVEDTGPGIAPENVPRLFQKFQQFGPAPTEGERGTGLGLSLCKALVTLHRGTIDAESTLGKGSRFVFTLPDLDATTLFREKIQGSLDQAVNEGHQSLSLLSLSFQNGSPMPPPIETRAQDVLRMDSDTMLKTATALWIFLPNADKSSAAAVVERLQQEFHDVDLRYKISSYPEDGNLIERLLALIV